MKKGKDNSHLTVFCKECKHQHVAKTGPCTKRGCGCHGMEEPVKKHKEKK